MANSQIHVRGLITTFEKELNSLQDGVTTYKKWDDITHEFCVTSSDRTFVLPYTGYPKQGLI